MYIGSEECGKSVKTVYFKYIVEYYNFYITKQFNNKKQNKYILYNNSKLISNLRCHGDDHVWVYDCLEGQSP